jgi:hypothetical protein
MLCEISDYKLLALQIHLQENGLIERIYENAEYAKRRNSKVFFNLELTSEVKHYLKQYGNTYGLPSPMRHRNDSGNFIYLPVGENYVSIYNKFKDYFYIEHDENEKVISYDTFKRFWIETISNLKF